MRVRCTRENYFKALIHKFSTFSPLRSDNDFIEVNNEQCNVLQWIFFRSHFLVNDLWNILPKYILLLCASFVRIILATFDNKRTLVDYYTIKLLDILCSINVDNLICTEWLLSIFVMCLASPFTAHASSSHVNMNIQIYTWWRIQR